jgi:hypothetical protein
MPGEEKRTTKHAFKTSDAFEASENLPSLPTATNQNSAGKSEAVTLILSGTSLTRQYKELNFQLLSLIASNAL